MEESGAHKWDGVAPRQSVCTSCGFHLGGLPLKDGAAICPECGNAVVFALPEPPPRRRVGTLPLVLLAAILLAFAGFLWQQMGWKAGVGTAGAAVAMWLALYTVRRRMLD